MRNTLNWEKRIQDRPTTKIFSLLFFFFWPFIEFFSCVFQNKRMKMPAIISLMCASLFILALFRFILLTYCVYFSYNLWPAMNILRRTNFAQTRATDSSVQMRLILSKSRLSLTWVKTSNHKIIDWSSSFQLFLFIFFFSNHTSENRFQQTCVHGLRAGVKCCKRDKHFRRFRPFSG